MNSPCALELPWRRCRGRDPPRRLRRGSLPAGRSAHCSAELPYPRLRGQALAPRSGHAIRSQPRAATLACGHISVDRASAPTFGNRWNAPSQQHQRRGRSALGARACALARYRHGRSAKPAISLAQHHPVGGRRVRHPGSPRAAPMILSQAVGNALTHGVYPQETADRRSSAIRVSLPRALQPRRSCAACAPPRPRSLAISTAASEMAQPLPAPHTSAARHGNQRDAQAAPPPDARGLRAETERRSDAIGYLRSHGTQNRARTPAPWRISCVEQAKIHSEERYYNTATISGTPPRRLAQDRRHQLCSTPCRQNPDRGSANQRLHLELNSFLRAPAHETISPVLDEVNVLERRAHRERCSRPTGSAAPRESPGGDS